MTKNKHVGSSLDDYLNEKGIYKKVDDVAMRRVLAWQVEQAIKEAGLTKTAMANRMKTSRASLNRLLDPKKPIKLDTIEKAAKALGKRLYIELV
ncbi:hypothetical protein MNBD_NITROSPINAE01-212 [hydrothermal vent metagenome]|uniref:HTH cro/C1-type domain-containing protein n=1 Tax=hydrothermal vent metagenome TaxID=652676 RepID=A0A3B1C4P0_9ZZZZ